MPRLIVNADDFGLTSGVNRAVLELHQAGLLTSATLMARAAATNQAIEMARATPTLGVGCHVVLLDGEPLSSVRDLPDIVEPVYGRLQPTLGRFLSTVYQRSAADKIERQIETEARTQIRFIQSCGPRLTHVDTHKHTHMFPRVLRPVLRAARACGITRVRNPFEPAWSIAATPGAPFIRRAQVRILRLLERSFYRIVAEEGFTTTAGAIGVLATGTLDAATVASLLRNLPDDTFELVTHPGYNDADLANARTRLLESRDVERQALTALRDAAGVELVSFASL